MQPDNGKPDFLDFIETAEEEGRLHAIYIDSAVVKTSHTIVIAGIPNELYTQHSAALANIPNVDLASALGVIITRGQIRANAQPKDEPNR